MRTTVPRKTRIRAVERQETVTLTEEKALSSRLPSGLLSVRARFAATVGILFILLFLRRPDALLNAQFWAEDGVVLFQDQILHGFWHSAVTPYGGYLVLIPRLIAALAAALPSVWAPLFCNAMALLIAAICCGMFVLPEYRHILESDLERFAVCVVLTSATYCDELSGSMAELLWYVTLAAILIVFRKSNSNASRSLVSLLLLGAAGAAIGCSSPVTLLLTPFLLWRLVHDRSTDRIWLGLMTAGIAIQGAVLLTFHTAQPSSTDLNGIVDAMIVAFLYRVLLCSVAGLRAAIWISQQRLSGVVLVALVLVTLWLTRLYHSSARRNRRTILISLYLLFSTLGMTMVGRPDNVLYYSPLVGLLQWRGERYFFLPACILVLLVALTIKIVWPSVRSGIAVVLLCAVFSAGLMLNFRIPAFYDFHWAAQAGKIDAWRKARASGEANGGVTIPVNPGGIWAVALPSINMTAAPKRSALPNGPAADKDAKPR